MMSRMTSMVKQSVGLILGTLALLGLAFSTDAVGGINAQGINAQGINAQGINAQGINAQGINAQGINAQGINAQGINAQGINAQGINAQGINAQGINAQGINAQGINAQGINAQGINAQGINAQGINAQGINAQGINAQGINAQGINAQGMGIDRARGQIALVQFRGLSGAAAPNPGINLQGLQSGTTPISYTEISDPTGGDPAGGVRLQFGPTSSTKDVGPGGYIRVPGFPETVTALKGSFWNMILADTCKTIDDCPQSSTCTQGACIKACTSDSQCTAAGGKCVQGSCSNVEGAIPLYIADVEKDSTDELVEVPVQRRRLPVHRLLPPARRRDSGPRSARVDPHSAKATAMAHAAQPAMTGPRAASRAKFTFACTASGVAAKCARNWGYKPWKTVGETVWDGRAGSARHGHPARAVLRRVPDRRARRLLPGRRRATRRTARWSICSTRSTDSRRSTRRPGSPTRRTRPGVMLHEEYQISALNLGTLSTALPAKAHCVSENLTAPRAERRSRRRCRRSGMQSSRYADRDPGTVLRGRAVHRSLRSEGAVRLLPRDEPVGAAVRRVPGRELAAPLLARRGRRRRAARSAVQRVRQPRLPGRSHLLRRSGRDVLPGQPGLGQRCTDIREKRSAARAAVSIRAIRRPVWPGRRDRWRARRRRPTGRLPPRRDRRASKASPATAAPAPPVRGTWYAEGWACDPDHPGASSPVQISVGGALGAPARRCTRRPPTSCWSPSWGETVAAECGGGGRHGFALPGRSAGQDVYVYGIDLDTPGAPFSLLRGAQEGRRPRRRSPRAPPARRIWTGWVDAASLGHVHLLQAPVGPSPTTCTAVPLRRRFPPGDDLYRVWVNGVYVGGNWREPRPRPAPSRSMRPPIVRRSTCSRACATACASSTSGRSRP